MTGINCAQLHELAPELALGLLDGEERAAAIVHVESCPRCRIEVASLAETADDLLLLAPEVEPPPDFEGGVLAQLPEPSDRRSAIPLSVRPRRARRAIRWAAAAVVVVLAGVVALTLAGSDNAPGSAATAEMRTGVGEVVGHARLEGEPTTIEVDVPGWLDLVRRYGASPDASYRVVVELDDGSRDLFTLPVRSDGRWRVSIDDTAAAVTSVAIVDDQGRTWCSARFS